MGSGKAPKVEETEQQKALAEVSRKRWDDYKTRFKPVESQFINEARNIGGAADRHRMAATVSADVAQAADRRLASAASNPNAVSDIAVARADAMSKGATAGVTGLREQRSGAMMKGAKFGQGLADSAVIGLSDTANRATESAIRGLERRITKRNATRAAAGAGLGMAASHFGWFGGNGMPGMDSTGWTDTAGYGVG